MRGLPCVVALLLVVQGCALFSKGEIVETRFFSPVVAGGDREAPPPREGRGEPLRLRIGRFASGDHLRERIVFRSSHYEIGEYEDSRWTEVPEEYVRRALARALFERGSLTQAVGGAAPSLDIEVLSFEEVRRGTARSDRVEIAYALRDDRIVLAARTIAVEKAAAAGEDPMATMVAAMSEALEEVAVEVAGEVTAALEKVPTPEPASPLPEPGVTVRGP